MKKTTKLLSVILALVMMFSTVSVAFAGTLNPNNKTTVEDFIKNDNLAAIVETLLSDLNSSKANITQPVLRICFLLVDQLKEAAGSTDVFNASEGQLAKILLDWLNANLPEWTSSITEQSWYSTVQKILPILSIELDLSSVNGVLATLYSVCYKCSKDIIVNPLAGDLGDLKGDAVDIKYNGTEDSAKKVIYALFQWLNDNRELLGKFVKGGIGANGLSLSNVLNDALGSALSTINNIVVNLPTFLKGYIFLAVDGYAEKPDLKDDPAGGWGKDTNYSAFNADELLAAALLKLIKNDKEAVIAKADADAALEKSFYDLLAENLDDLFANYDAAGWLNENVPKFVDSISVTDAIKAVFNSSISFTNDTFKDIFTGAVSTGVLGQVNNLLCKIAEIALVPAENTKLALVKGGNENLNANFKKVCQYILPLMANKTVSDTLGYDFTKFTADAVKTMELKDMAVAILKIFFEDWFDNAVKADVDKAATLEQLGALAVYYTATNTEWFPFTNTVSAPAASLSSDDATKYILDTGALIGLNALKYNGSKIYFDTTVTKGYENIADEISDWGLNFVKGIPAVIVQEQDAKRMTNARNTLDDAVNGGAFYKVNVVLNELIDFSFFTNDAGDYDVAPTTFKFDLGLFLTNTLLDNIYDFDLAGVLGAFKKNSDANNSLNKTVISAVLGIADRAVTALFKHTDKASSGTITAKTDDLAVGTEKVCTKQVTKTFTNYDTVSGHYLGTTSAKTTEKTNATHNNSIRVANVNATCAKEGYTTVKCSVCGLETTTKKAKTAHKWDAGKVTKAATCAAAGVKTFTCTVCKTTKTESIAKLTTHTYKDGKCTVCGTKDPNYKPTPVGPTYKLGDVDNDGSIKAADARLALRRAVNLENYAPGTAQYLACDVDKDGSVKAADARLILRAAVNLEDATKW